MIGDGGRQRGGGFLSGILGEGLGENFDRIRTVFASAENDDSHSSLFQNRWSSWELIQVVCFMSSAASVRNLGSTCAGGLMVFVRWIRRSGPSVGVVGGGVYGARDFSIGEWSRDFPGVVGGTCCFALLLDRVFRGRLGLSTVIAELREG